MLKFGLEEKVIDQIVDIIKEYDEVEKVKIFGSRARGDYKNQSDIDIALYGEKLTNSINTNIFYDIDKLYLPYKIDLINFNTLKNEKALRENIESEGVIIYVK